MLKQRIAAANGIAERFLPIEESHARTMEQLGHVIAFLPEARRMANFHEMVGHDVDRAVSEAYQASVEAKSKILAVHTTLRDLQEKTRLAQFMVGGTTEKDADAAADYKRTPVVDSVSAHAPQVADA